MKISVIIPAYNEEKHIKKCIESLLQQKYPDFEIIVVDDGSIDGMTQILNDFASQQKIILTKQNHLGPGHARNLGVSLSSGEILVFVDADMVFNEDFLQDLVAPIILGMAKGTFSREEYVANWSSKIAKFWQYNRGIFDDKMIGKEYQEKAPVFRAILKSEFLKVGGYDSDIGYTDDWTLSRKLGYESTLAEGAKYYHNNPDSLREVFVQAHWIGRNEFISGSLTSRLKSALKYNIFSSIIRGIITSIRIKNLEYLFFQIVYDFAIFSSVLSSFSSKNKIK